MRPAVCAATPWTPPTHLDTPRAHATTTVPWDTHKQRGQLGHGDLLQRNTPTVVAALQGKKVVGGAGVATLCV
jgi:hypothetical protein